MFWLTDPSVLFNANTWYTFVPTPTMSVPDALNAVVRFSVYLSVLLVLTTRNPFYALFVPLVMALTVFLEAFFPKVKTITEGFGSGLVVSGYTGPERSRPTPDNPFMNPHLSDINDNPDRPPADDVTKVDVRNEVNRAFAQTSNIYMDTSDVFEMMQAQRNFHTVVADDHGGLLKFLGKNAKSDKILNEGYVAAKGTVPELPSAVVSTAPTGASPAH
jgi:Family of unknown function (DUF5762)